VIVIILQREMILIVSCFIILSNITFFTGLYFVAMGVGVSCESSRGPWCFGADSIVGNRRKTLVAIYKNGCLRVILFYVVGSGKMGPFSPR